ncbi:MAG: NADH-quinone oxidoreductase subunit J [Anaerolineales bacterium]|nr:MAG: NADH-quinone oxidoreductase subunit J [Anaerolineales bacterium]
MSIDMILFIGIALIAVATAISMLASRHAIYSALFLVLNILTIAALYLLLNAAFIAVVQVTVYAGAIMVLFLFVLMLLGPEEEQIGKSIPWQMPVAILLALGLAAELAYALLSGWVNGGGPLDAVTAEFGSPASIGRVLFNEYMIPFEITSVLLLVAMVGAIQLTMKRKREGQ